MIAPDNVRRGRHSWIVHPALVPKAVQDSRFVDSLKARYRPFICPFKDLMRFVRPGDRICDVGCGSGQFSLLLTTWTAAAGILGIEIDERLVNNARWLCGLAPHEVPIEFRLFNGFDFPESVGDCTLVFMVDVLHHVAGPRQQEFLNSLHRAMVPGARLILKDIDRDSRLVIFNKLHDLVLAGEVGRERGLREATAMCEAAGFRILTTFTTRRVVYPHYFVVVEKRPQYTLESARAS